VDTLQALHTALVDTKQDYWAGQVEIQHRAAAAWLARVEGKQEDAVRLMREAAALEDATEKHPVTPGPIFPTRELSGALLLELQQPAQALQEFETSMPKEPNRFNGLYGAARAAELAGEVEKARTYYGQLMALSERSDTDRPALQQAKAFLAKK
jgi:tetratricopeptide (TPR) repeat protein